MLYDETDDDIYEQEEAEEIEGCEDFEEFFSDLLACCSNNIQRRTLEHNKKELLTSFLEIYDQTWLDAKELRKRMLKEL